MKRMSFPKCANWFNQLSVLIVCICFVSFVGCNEVLCGDPPQIPNAQPDLQGLRPQFHNGTNITYNCIDGFVLQPGANPHAFCVADNETASWIYDENVLCIHTQVCGALPVIPHGKLLTEGKDPPYQPGVKIRVICDLGYITGGYNLQIECTVTQEGAVWTLPERQCRPRSCNFPGVVENADLTGGVYTFPNNVTYRCKEGYKMRGSATIFCLPSGSWSNRLPTCEAIVCPLLSHPENGQVISVGRHYDAVASYKCDRGHRLEGPSERSCGSNEQWSGSSPTCKIITCFPPGEFKNGRVLGNANGTSNFDDIIIFSCLYSAQTRSSKCLESGEWSVRPPNCPGPPDLLRTDAPPVVTVSPPTEVPTTNSSGETDGVKPIPTTIIIGIVVGIILLVCSILGVYFYYRWKVNHPKGYGKKSKALSTDATDQDEMARLDKGKKPIPVTSL